MNKESVLYISIMEYISDACSDMKMNTDRLGFRPFIVHQANDMVISKRPAAIFLLRKVLSQLKTPQNFSVFLSSILYLWN